MKNILKLKYWLMSFLLVTMTCQALPDIPSFMDCEDVIFNSGFQDDSDPSNGIGGDFPGAFTRTVLVNGINREFYISIPPNYNPANPIPLLFAWHGAAGPNSAQGNALATRNYWKTFADNNNFIVMAQASSSGNGWGNADDVPVLSGILDDLLANYNIEQTRIYGHGFSAGAHVMHELMLLNSQYFAGYISSAGVLQAYAGNSAPFNSTRKIPIFASAGQTDPLLNGVITDKNTFLNAGWVDGKNYWLDIFIGGHQLLFELQPKAWDKLCTISNLQ